MSNYSDQIFGPGLGSGDSDLRSDQREAIEKMIRETGILGKKKKRKATKKKLKRLEEQLQVLAADHQRILKLENDRHKKKRRRKGRGKQGKNNQAKRLKALELQCQQQQIWTQEILANTFLRILSSTAAPMNWPQLPNQPVIELPPPRGQK